MEQVLSEVDVMQIRACWLCTEIFFAKPRNKRYCSDICKNSAKDKQHYKKDKRLKLGLPAREESFYEFRLKWEKENNEKKSE